METRLSPSDRRIELVKARLDQARRAWRAVDAASSLLRGLTIVLVVLLIALVADNLVALPRAARAVGLVVFLAAVAYLIVFELAYRLLRGRNDETVARHVERSYPELDNRLINAVLLQKERTTDPVTRRLVISQLDETVRAVRTCDMASSTSTRPLWQWGRWAAALLLVVVFYAISFSRHFANAVRRYSAPHRFIPPITDTVLTVHPGDAECLQGESLTVEAHVEGVLPETAHVFFDDPEEGMARKTMPFEGSFFAYKLVGLQRDFRYWVKAGDANSDTFRVIVRTRPTVQKLAITYIYPDYTGLASKTEESQTGNIRALVGTRVRLDVTADKLLGEAHLGIDYLVPGEQPGQADCVQLPMRLAEPQRAVAEFEIQRSGQYRITITDKAGVPNEPVARQLVALPDDPPYVQVVEPGKDVTAEPEAKVALLVEVRDDFAIRSLAVFVQRAAGGNWDTLRTWPYSATKQTREGAVIDLAQLQAKPGEVLSYYFRASDGRPGRDERDGKSRIYQIAVIDKAQASSRDQQQRAGLRNLIARLIAMQKGNLDNTLKLALWPQEARAEIAEDQDAREQFQARSTAIVKVQEDIYSLATEGVKTYTGSELGDMVEGLASIASREMSLAVEQLEDLRAAARNEQVPQSAQGAAGTEQEIVDLLQQLLRDAKVLFAERLKERGTKQQLADKPEDLRGEKERVENLLEALKKFQEEQREVVEMTKQLRDVPVDQFTEEDQKKLEEIVQTELKWAKYFQETATDLSKVAPQDFSLGSMAKEHLEVYSAVLKAANAASRKATEIACAAEEGASAKAQTIKENIEKWLMDAPDREAWKVEEPDHDLDVPLADLPDELEDLIGDLLEEEQDLVEEAQDATSGWLGSADEGIGWDTMDGPFSNMTAKGVTGNRLPDAHEVGGRSGEGRTGKSSGQHVEETATGKGGRNTPTRLTPDPFEAGVVKDTSAEPPTGSTGGGKVSGWGQEGFQGPLPPAAQQALKRLANMQQQLIDQARRIDFGLEKYRYPRGQLPDTISMMEQIQKQLQEGTFIPTAAREHKAVLTNLRELKDLVDKQKQLTRDRSALLPEELREEIAAALREEVPREYRELVDNYFRALSETGTR